MGQKSGAWQFWIDRGGTFTDIVGVSPEGRISALKLLSEAPGLYDDAAIAGIRRLLDLPEDAPIPAHALGAVKIGTTVATNALLERKIAKVGLITTKGFRDVLELRRSARADLYDLFQDAPATLIPRRRRFEITRYGTPS